MDQFSSVLGRENMLMLLDCRSQEVRTWFPSTDPDVSVVIANTNVKHELTGGEYAQRRRECETAHTAFGVPLLRDARMSDLQAAQDRLDPVPTAERAMSSAKSSGPWSPLNRWQTGTGRRWAN